MAEEAQRCKWQHPADSEHTCQEPALPSSKHGHCIFHEQSRDKDADALTDVIHRKLGGHDFDFSGYYFPFSVLAFEGLEFDESVSFSFAEFLGMNTSFSGATFLGPETDFSFAQFSGGNTMFTETVFKSKQVSFQGARFVGEEVEFAGARFLAENTDFTCSHF